MMNILQIVFAIITVSLSAYLLITRDYDLIFLMILFSVLFMLTKGIEAFQRERKVYGWLLIDIFLFAVYISMYQFTASL
ncbi:hypothetical protein KQ41_17745 [Lysinibacillus fusiformis]|uniref:DUF3953 domain-containing protein n=1 Tax=Lysinibacillus fusiformis TaxID=28031 RepID=UPI000504F2B2|nr:DUF3953 domain-containing protein [Lysinibacillus fusiformis]KGA80683.1 hypothetical protein KQ41_17745 [Lysinibacillus fusiformis]